MALYAAVPQSWQQVAAEDQLPVSKWSMENLITHSHSHRCVIQSRHREAEACKRYANELHRFLSLYLTAFLCKCLSTRRSAVSSVSVKRHWSSFWVIEALRNIRGEEAGVDLSSRSPKNIDVNPTLLKACNKNLPQILLLLTSRSVAGGEVMHHALNPGYQVKMHIIGAIKLKLLQTTLYFLTSKRPKSADAAAWDSTHSHWPL